MNFLMSFLLVTIPLVQGEIDRNASSFEQREKKRIDRFDFSGIWPNIEVIDIDAKRKKCVEIDLSGDYPLLESINFEGGFGLLKGDITGNFPQLALMNFLCGSCRMTLDLTSKWSRSCEINVRGANEDVTLLLPPDIGLVVKTRVGARGKVVVDEGLKKKGFGFLKKNYQNKLAETSEIVLHINVETADGHIYLSLAE